MTPVSIYPFAIPQRSVLFVWILLPLPQHGGPALCCAVYYLISPHRYAAHTHRNVILFLRSAAGVHWPRRACLYPTTMAPPALCVATYYHILPLLDNACYHLFVLITVDTFNACILLFVTEFVVLVTVCRHCHRTDPVILTVDSLPDCRSRLNSLPVRSCHGCYTRYLYCFYTFTHH